MTDEDSDARSLSGCFGHLNFEDSNLLSISDFVFKISLDSVQVCHRVYWIAVFAQLEV